MARRQKVTDDPTTPEDEAAEALQARKDNPGSFAALEIAPGQFDYVTLDEERPRRINFHGTNYEHVAEDADGVWVYRQM